MNTTAVSKVLSTADPSAYTVLAALKCPEPEFAMRAVLAVLGRNPTLHQMLDIHERRARGTSRGAILRALLRVAADEDRPAPEDWALALPRRIDVSRLVATDANDAEFIREAYETILRRTPGADEVARQTRHLRWPRTRSDFLAALASSPESDTAGGEITLVGLGLRGPSVKRLIERFRRAPAEAASSVASAELTLVETVHRELQRLRESVADLVSRSEANSQREIENLNARGEQISALGRQLAAVETTLGRLRIRLETEGAKTSEIASDTRVMQEMLRNAQHSLDSLVTSVGQVAASGAELAKKADETARCSEETLATTRPLTSVPAALRDLKLANTSLETALQQVADASRSAVPMLHDLTEVPEAVHRIEDLVADTAVSVARAEEGLGLMGKRIVPPVVPGGDTVVIQVDGFFLGIPAREWRLSTHYHNRGPLEPGVYSFFQNTVRPGMTVVDVGANVGLYTLLSARLLEGQGTVFSFEPTPDTFNLLENNVRLNGFAEPGVVRLHNAAVTDCTGFAELHTDLTDSTWNSLFPTVGQNHRIRVPCVSLDDALAGERRVDFVKIDAEGAEPLVVRGMKSVIAANPGIRILMEFSPSHIRRSGVDPGAFLDQLRELSDGLAVIHALTGEVLPIENAALLAADTANLLVQR